MTATTSIAGWVFSPAFVLLCDRRRDLAAIVPSADGITPAELAAMYALLADDFEAAEHPVTAGMLRKQGERLEGRRNGH